MSLTALPATPNGPYVELARVDLNVPARTALIVEIALSPAGQAYVRTHRHLQAILGAEYVDPCGRLELFDRFSVTLTWSDAHVAEPTARRAGTNLRRVRPGCTRICQHPSGPPPPRMKLLAATATVQGNDAPIGLSCQSGEPCQGVLQLLTTPPPATLKNELARVDLDIPAHTDLIVDVTLAPTAVSYLHAHTPATVYLFATYFNRCADILGTQTLTEVLDA
jgi:hypothetical protein